LMLVFSIVAIIEAALRFVSQRTGFGRTAPHRRRWRGATLCHR
jgi:hypothetical protein